MPPALVLSGSTRWTDDIEMFAARVMPKAGIGRRWYVGRPIIVTRNDYSNRTSNGDVGIVIARSGAACCRVCQAVACPRSWCPPKLGDVETWWATTIHKSQGVPKVPAGHRHPAPATLSDPDPGTPVHRRHPGLPRNK